MISARVGPIIRIECEDDDVELSISFGGERERGKVGYIESFDSRSGTDITSERDEEREREKKSL